jgi:hemolysin D
MTNIDAPAPARSGIRYSPARVTAGLFILLATILLGLDLWAMAVTHHVVFASLPERLGPDLWSRIIGAVPNSGDRDNESLRMIAALPACLIALSLGLLVLPFAMILRGLYRVARAILLPRENRDDWGFGAREELQFLPAALEIVQTPPSPIGRTIGATIIAAFCLAIGWASIGKIDIVASAGGKVVPTGRTKVIQPFEAGVVRAIKVRDGQHVKAGETLIELDSTMNSAERDHLRNDLLSARLEVARLEATLADDPERAFEAPAGASAALVSLQRRYLASQIAEYQAKLSALDRQRAQKVAETATITATIAKLNASQPLIQQRVAIRHSLSGFGTRLNYLELVQLLTENQEDLKVQGAHLKESEASIATIDETRKQTAEEYRRMRYGELAEAERKAAGLAEDLVKAEERTRLQLLKAPVDGTVQQLAIHTVGGVVTPAQGLLVLVPEDSHLEIEAMVANRDIGFVHEGQPVEIKVDTFNFTRYGLLRGRVVSVSTDAISHDGSSDKSGDRAGEGSNDKGSGPFYAARVSLERTSMQIDDRLVNLASGMSVTAEIHTGQRRLISYLLSPLAKYSHESLRER